MPANSWSVALRSTGLCLKPSTRACAAWIDGIASSRSCGDCHPGYTTSAVNAATHVDGARQVGNRITAWNASTRACTGCHGAASW